MKLRNNNEPTREVKHQNVSRIYSLNRSGVLKLVVFLMLPFLLTSCEAIAGIFKAGMGFGIFIVIAVIIAIVVFFTRMGRNKNS